MIFSQFLETTAIHFDDIFRLLLDDLLSEEVEELNKAERRKN
jgi:hypothetical protein